MSEEPYQITMEKVLPPEEVRNLLSTCRRRAKQDLASGRKVWVTRYLLVHLACASGLRAGEIAWLRVGDFKSEEGAWFLGVRRPNSGGSRQVHLGPQLAEHIEEYLRVRSRTWGETLKDEDLLLPGRNGKPYTAAALCFSFRKAAEAANLSGSYSLRNARHSYSAFLLASTGDLRYVQRQLGHASQSMTMLYRDVTPQINPELAEALIW